MRPICYAMIALLCILPSLSALAGGRPETVQGIARIIDGDTIAFGGQRIRLFGIDAPESTQVCDVGVRAWRCGEAARDILARQIGNRPVRCEIQDTDPYGRLVAVCINAQGEDLNAFMVVHGLAVAYTQYSRAYERAQTVAQERRWGIWGGPFVRPDVYRHNPGSVGASADRDSLTSYRGNTRQPAYDDTRTTDRYPTQREAASTGAYPSSRYGNDAYRTTGYDDAATEVQEDADAETAEPGERIPQDTSRATFKGMACVVLGKGCR